MLVSDQDPILVSDQEFKFHCLTNWIRNDGGIPSAIKQFFENPVWSKQKET